MLLVFGRAPAAVDDEAHPVARGGGRRPAQRAVQRRIELGDARDRVVEDRRAGGHGAVGLAQGALGHDAQNGAGGRGRGRGGRQGGGRAAWGEGGGGRR